jgi:cytochrome bd-type quinol oxidase subunit 2
MDGVGEKKWCFGEKHFLFCDFFVISSFVVPFWVGLACGSFVRGGYVFLRVKIVFNLLNSYSID